MSDLYDADIVTWSEHQAALLRRLAAGERVNDQVDWENVVEEIESVGRSERKGVASDIVQAFVHHLKAEAWPNARDREHWLDEARQQRGEARLRCDPGMISRLDIAELYREALRRMPDTYDGIPPRPVPSDCPVTLDAFITEP